MKTSYIFLLLTLCGSLFAQSEASFENVESPSAGLEAALATSGSKLVDQRGAGGTIVAPMTSYNSPTCSDGSISAPTAWAADENLGSDNSVTFYFTWDATYFYVAWVGVNTVSNDNVCIAFDENPGDFIGATAAYWGASFTGPNLPDYAVVMQWGTGANAVVYNPKSGSGWGADQDVNTWDYYAANDLVAVNELRIPRTYLGTLTNTANDFAVWIWATNNAGNFVWAAWPSENPSGGLVTLNYALLYASSDAGRAPNTYGSAVLPVEIVSFTAFAKGLGVELAWKTATEVNNHGFEIERRNVLPSLSAGQGWAKVGFVEGAGTSYSPREYTYVDPGIAPSRYAYRIKQINNDGTFKYYHSVEVELGLAPKAFKLEANYPNPFNPSTNIEFTLPEDGRAMLKVFNVMGQEVAVLFDAEAEAGRIQQVRFVASTFSAGVYYARLEFKNQQLVRKLMLLK